LRKELTRRRMVARRHGLRMRMWTGESPAAWGAPARLASRRLQRHQFMCRKRRAAVPLAVRSRRAAHAQCWIDTRPCIARLRMCDVHVRFTNGSATRSTLADTRYVFHVHGSFATGIVLWSLLARRHARPTAFATTPRHRPLHAPVNCAAVGAVRIGARSLRALFARIQMYPSGSSLRRTHRKLITRWPESWRALLESSERDIAVGARRIAVCLCQAPPRRARISTLRQGWGT
jgi:hypothetical protein